MSKEVLKTEVIKAEINNKNINNPKMIIIAIVTLSIIMVSSLSFLFYMVLDRREILIEEQEYYGLVTELMFLSDFLTESVQYYVETGDEAYYNEYIEEVFENKRREKAVDELLNLSIGNERSGKLVQEMLNLSNELAEIEMDAFVYAKAQQYDKAKQLIFSEEYKTYKNEIRNKFNMISKLLGSSIDEQNFKLYKIMILAFVVTLGVSLSSIIIVTRLVTNFLKVQKETEIDMLTGLQNRNKYKNNIAKLIKDEPNKFGALIFADIDNLKFINECYGHKNGDLYIQALATKLKSFNEFTSVIARLAGDEFVIYIHGFDTEEEVKAIIDNKLKDALDSYFLTTINVEERLRFSAGVSIYPKDSGEVDDLLKFSDYAMLKLKKSSKGEISYYDKKSFDLSTFFLKNKGHVDEFIEKELLDFAFQPIVDAKTFEIYGYEALMRPKMDVLKSPLTLLQLAKEESKLDKVERLTLKKVFEKIDENKKKFCKKRIFVNSIADRILSKEELDEFKENFSDVLKNTIVEVTEQEYVTEVVLKTKIDMFRDVGALIALDDYGAGYANEFTLLSGLYDIVKIDMKIIRDIDTDIKRQEIVKSIIKVSSINNYKVLAEGVETEEEVKILREIGVDYLQGYYIGRPSIEIKGISEDVLSKLDSNYNWID